MIGGFLRRMFGAKNGTSDEVSRSGMRGDFTATLPDDTHISVISGDHPFRDPALGFLDAPAVRRQLLHHLKDHSKENPAFIIALDAKNLGSLNAIAGRDTAEKIWGAYVRGYVDVLAREFPNADVLCGFRDVGDEAQIVISGLTVSEARLEKVLAQAQTALDTQFKPMGLDRLPALDPLRAGGFGLHHAAERLSDYKHKMTYQSDNPEYNDLYEIIELAVAKTKLNTQKPESGGVAPPVLSPEKFSALYGAAIERFAADSDKALPQFSWPAALDMSTSQAGSQKELHQKRREFLRSGAPDAVLLRFDFSGLKTLNKTLSILTVENIVSRMAEVVDHHFILKGRDEGWRHQSFAAGSGVVDVLVPAVVARDFDEAEARAHINQTLDFHLQNNLMPLSGDGVRADVYDALDKELAFVRALVVDGDPDATLRAAGAAMDKFKQERAAKKTALAGGASAVNTYDPD